MAVYLFTLHSYRSWNPDRPEGFVQLGRGIQPTNLALARHYHSVAKDEPVLFSERHQQTIAWIVWDVCQQREWRLHHVACEATHVHILVSWPSYRLSSAQSWQQVRGKLKNLISWALSKEFRAEGKRWLTRYGSRKRVANQEHFDYLMQKYLPDHRGLNWREGDATPAEPSWNKR